MNLRSERGNSVVLMFCAITSILLVMSAVALTIDRTLENHRRDEVRVAALWLARSGIDHPGSREVTVHRARLRLTAGSDGKRRVAEVVAEGFGTAKVEANGGAATPDSWTERWTTTSPRTPQSP